MQKLKMGKKATAMFLMVIMLLGVLPTEIFANTQYEVNSLKLSNFPTDSGYSIAMQWKRPDASPKEDPVRPDTESLTERANSYDIYMRNATDRTSYEVNHTIKSTDPGSTDENMAYTLNAPLLNGKLYMFKVDANHTHLVTVNVAGGGTRPTYPNATKEKLPEVNEAIYLTDLNVSAQGTGKTLNVQWDNATFNGANVFTGYNIYYAVGGPDVDPGNVKEGKATAMIGDPKLKLGTNGQWSYSFDDSELKQGRLYAVIVEPIYDGRELRGKDYTPNRPQTQVTINQKTYGIAYSAREYRTNKAYVEPSLTITRDGLDFLLLSWPDLSRDPIDIQSIRIEKSITGDFTDAKEDGTLLLNDAKTINYWKTSQPKVATRYRIVITYIDPTTGEAIPMYSEKVWFNPSEENFVPMKPEIIKVTDNANPALNVMWQAFERDPYNDFEKTQLNGRNKYVDKDIEYDFWVTDDVSIIDSLTDADRIVSGLSPLSDITAYDYSYTITNPSGLPEPITKTVYDYNLSQYVTLGENGYEKRPIEDNKVYYIKVIARRTTEEQQTSDPAYASWFIMPKADIGTIPFMISKPPLRIKKDKDGLDVITKESVTIQWDLNWFEVYNPDDKTWYSEIGVGTDGTFLFGDAVTAEIRKANRVIKLNDVKYTGLEDVAGGYGTIKADLLALAGSEMQDDIDLLALRYMNLKNANYEIHAVEYALMEAAGGYETYLKAIKEDDWQKITPVGDVNHPEYPVTKANNVAGPIKPNTSYAILFRPYEIQKDGTKKAYYPNVVVGTTLSDRPEVEITPTVPALESVTAGDVWLQVRYKYVEGLQYELAYGDLMSQYPAGGTMIPDADMVRDGEIKTVDGVKYMYYTIRRLFPETTYYIWIRSFANMTAGKDYSDWSNAISMTTTELLPPKAPQGLGLASNNHVDIINKENGLTYLPVDDNYMIIEWLKNMNDESVSAENAKPGGTAGAASTEILTSKNITGTYMAKFNQLTANKEYHVRAKTVLTVTKGKDKEGLQYIYQYVVQLSLDEDFKDHIEVTVPPLANALDPVYTRVKESEWTEMKTFKTGRSDGEYDGDKNPDLYPLPTTDYELIYERGSDTLTYRLRSDGVDANGNKDNSVDQRFISRLVQNKVFDFTVDLSTYNNKAVANRVLEMPYSIITALEERKISLSIKSGDTTYTFRPGFINTAEVQGMKDYGVGSKIKFTIKQNPTGVPTLTNGEKYAAEPQKMTVFVTTPTKSANISTLAKPVDVVQKISNRSVAVDKNVGSYVNTSNDIGWVRASDNYNSATGELKFSTAKVANYAVIAKSAPQQNSYDNASNNAMYTINSSMSFKDMTSYTPSANVTAWQMNKVIAALANGDKSVTINADLTDAEVQSLSKSGMLVPGGQYVTRESAINSLVKLYEVKTGSKIKNYPSLGTTQYADISSASQAYQVSMLKADSIGLLGTGGAANPKGNLTFAEMLRMIEIVIMDAGI